MAAQVTVLDLTRRHIIKVTPAIYLSEVRDEACRKSNKRHTNFDLKSNGKNVDLSQTWRQCGLSPGAKLELVEASRTPSAVAVALQLPPELPGGRLMDKVRSDETLWQVLRRFETISGINITQRGVASLESGQSGAGRIFYEMPRLNLTGRMASSMIDLQKTLAQFGFNSGSVLMKLDFIRTTRPLEEAMAEIAAFFKRAESETTAQPGTTDHGDSYAPSPSIDSPNASANAVQTPAEPTAEQPRVDQPGASTIETQVQTDPMTSTSPTSQLQVFAPPTSTVLRAATLPHNEQDYEPTISQIEKHNTHLAAQTHNQRLLSDAEEAAAQASRAAKIASITEVKIKIRFPDQSIVVDTLTAVDTCAELYRRVRSMMQSAEQDFRLVYLDRGPQTVPDNENKRLIRDLGLVGNVLINLHWGDGVAEIIRKEPVLKAELRALAMEDVVQDFDAHQNGADENAVAKPTDEKSTKEKVKGAMPKWFKGIGKK